MVTHTPSGSRLDIRGFFTCAAVGSSKISRLMVRKVLVSIAAAWSLAGASEAEAQSRRHKNNGLFEESARLLAFVLLVLLADAHILAVQSKGTPFETLSLDRLATESDFAFVGKSIETVDGESAEGALPVRVTVFKIEIPIKGKLKVGETISVKQFAGHSISTDDGEFVLWFLKAKDKVENSLASPVGRSSGDFRRVEVASDENVSTFMVQNQVGNRGLWGNQDGDKLWNSTTFKREVADAFLEKLLSKKFPGLKSSDPRTFEYKKKMILDVGEYPCKPKPIPIEFVLAATHARLSVQ